MPGWPRLLILLLACMGMAAAAPASDQGLVLTGGLGDIRFDGADDARQGERSPFFLASTAPPRFLFDASVELYAWNRLGIGGHWFWLNESYYNPTATPDVYRITDIRILHKFQTMQLVPYLSDDRALRWIVLAGRGSAAYDAHESIQGNPVADYRAAGPAILRGIVLDWDRTYLSDYFGSSSQGWGGRIGLYRIATDLPAGAGGEYLNGSGDVLTFSARYGF